jgi:hypothetical protein
MLSLLIVVNAGGTTNTEASLETVGRVKTSKNDAATSGSSEKTESDGDSSSVNGQSQSGDEGSQPSAPSGQQQSVPGSPGTSPPTTRPPTTSPPTTITCPTNSPTASGSITSSRQLPSNSNDRFYEYYASGSVTVTNTANRPVSVDVGVHLISSSLGGDWLDLGSATVGSNSTATLSFSNESVYAYSSTEIEVLAWVTSFRFQC